MRQKTLIVLAVITVPTALAAAFVPQPATSVEKPAESGPLLPGLKPALANVTTLTVAGPDGTVTLAHKPVAGKPELGWTMSDKGGYPVQESTIKPVIESLIALHGVEPKTERPKLYSMLDLGEPGKGSQARLVTFSDSADKPLAQLVVGKLKYGAEGESETGIYVRKLGDARTWLAKPSVTLPADALAWVDRSIVNIEPDKIKEVVLTPVGGAPLDFVRNKAGDKLAVKDLPKDVKLKSEDPGAEVASAFNLELDDVKPAAQVTAAPIATEHVVTFDGLTADLTLVRQDDKTWVTVTASGTGDAAKTADAITARTKGWAYQIPDTSVNTLETKLSDLQEAPAAKPEATPGPTAKPVPAKKAK